MNYLAFSVSQCQELLSYILMAESVQDKWPLNPTVGNAPYNQRVYSKEETKTETQAKVFRIIVLE